MPITKSAKKSLRVSIKKEKANETREIQLEKALKKVNKDNVNDVISLIDKAAKTGLFHANKAARMKSALAHKFGTPKVEKSKEVKETKTAKPAKAETEKPAKKAAEPAKTKVIKTKK